jgi:hypothetical protein
MTQPRWADDESLLADLGQALAAGAPHSESLVEAGRAAFTWRTVDEELAGLAYDSLLDDRVLVRGTVTTPRSLVFEAGEVSVELEVGNDRVVGQFIPPMPGEVAVCSQTAELGHATADDAGCFTLSVPADVLVRLRCTTGAATFVTDWVRT